MYTLNTVGSSLHKPPFPYSRLFLRAKFILILENVPEDGAKTTE